MTSSQRCKLRLKSPGKGELWRWTLRGKLAAAVTPTVMDLWYHTPVLPTSLPEGRWPCTSPPGWGRCPWTATATSPATWRTAPCRRTPSPRPPRSSTSPKSSIPPSRDPARTRSRRLWWRRRGRQSCDLYGTVHGDIKLEVSQLSSPVNRARTLAHSEKGGSPSWTTPPLLRTTTLVAPSTLCHRPSATVNVFKSDSRLVFLISFPLP